MNDKKYDLVTVQNETNALAIFSDGNIKKLISDIEQEVLSIVPDLSTNKGRAAIASLAHKVSKTKVGLDNLRKGLVSEWKNKAKAVDADGKLMRDSFDALRDKVRAPLNEYEEAEKKRIADELLEKEINESYEQAIIENDLLDKQKEAEKIKLEEDAERQRLMDKKQVELDKKQEELDAKQLLIDQKEAEQKQKEREDSLQKEAAERAKVEAEEKAKSEIDAANKREREQKEATERAQREAAETEARVKREAEAEKQRELEEAEKREANKKHKAKINNESVTALIAGGMNETNAKKAVVLIAKRLIPNVTISY